MVPEICKKNLCAGQNTERKKAGLRCDWLDGEDVMRHWTQDDEIRGQIKFEDLFEDLIEEQK